MAARCLVIGGSGQLGRALVGELARLDARVAFTYHQGKDVADGLISAHGPMPSASIDLAKPDEASAELDELIDALGGLDAMVYCAAVPSTCTPEGFDAPDDVDLDGWRRLMDINVTGAFFASRQVASRFGDEGGNIVLLGSVDGIKPIPTPVPYATSKAALRGMTLSLAKAYGSKKIRTNMVAPGILEAGASRVVPEDLRAEYLKHSALKRYGKLAEATGLIAWLALDNQYVTGQTILLDGGL